MSSTLFRFHLTPDLIDSIVLSMALKLLNFNLGGVKMGCKKTIYMSDDLEKVFFGMTREGESPAWSDLVSMFVNNGIHLFRENLPDLTEEEWQEILNVYAGSHGVLAVRPYRVASDLMDHYALIDVNDHPMPELVKKVHAMTQVEQFSLLMAVKIFWSNDWSDTGRLKDVIRDIKMFPWEGE